MKVFRFLLLLLLATTPEAVTARETPSAAAEDDALSALTLWNVPELLSPPRTVEYGEVEGLTRAVWYESEPFEGKPTRVFAWLGRPAETADRAPKPAMLLVHGGGGKAFREWARHWAERGYVALAMDTAGQGPDGKRHAQAGPDQSDAVKFRHFTAAEAKDMWTYHAVAAVLRGHGLLASLPEVDRGRIGITGISWGGYLTCLTAGLDPELKVAVPVYGCGFLGENSCWKDTSLAAMTPEARALWLRLFDPSETIGRARLPILFLNGTKDFAYPPDSYRKTYRLVPPEHRTLSVRTELPHGHIWTFPEVDAFVDHALRPGPQSPPLTRFGDPEHDGKTVRAPILSGPAPVSAELHWTTDTGDWKSRRWTSVPAEITPEDVRATPPEARPLTFFFTAKDSRGLVTGSSHDEIPAAPEASGR